MFAYFNIISTVGKVIFPSLLWNFNIKEKCVYLTFDDGPVPGITPWVLEKLREYDAKATFFCIGDNVSKHPEIFKMILDDGHVKGNHSHNHLNGWKTDCKSYVSNVLKAEMAINEFAAPRREHSKSLMAKKLFRPPYGRITPSQIREIEARNYKIVMWDVISEDYNIKNPAHNSIKNIIRYSKPGSIIVFHDSEKAFPNLQFILPEILKYFADKGFEFRSL